MGCGMRTFTFENVDPDALPQFLIHVYKVWHVSETATMAATGLVYFPSSSFDRSKKRKNVLRGRILRTNLGEFRGISLHQLSDAHNILRKGFGLSVLSDHGVITVEFAAQNLDEYLEALHYLKERSQVCTIYQ